MGGIDINKPRMRAAMEAAMALSVAPRGFCTADHAAKMHDILGAAGTTYAARHSAYDLKKLRAKGRIEKLPLPPPPTSMPNTRLFSAKCNIFSSHSVSQPDFDKTLSI